jgi:hypothetical protein
LGVAVVAVAVAVAVAVTTVAVDGWQWTGGSGRVTVCQRVFVAVKTSVQVF